jgi:hypothetical protein
MIIQTKIIPYIFLEWLHYANNRNELCPDIDRLIEVTTAVLGMGA